MDQSQENEVRLIETIYNELKAPYDRSALDGFAHTDYLGNLENEPWCNEEKAGGA